MSKVVHNSEMVLGILNILNIPILFKTIQFRNLQTFQTFEKVGTHSVQVFQIFRFADSQIYKNTTCAHPFPCFIYLFKSTSVINKGPEGPHLINMLRVPKSMKNIGMCPQAIIHHFLMRTNHKTPKHQYKNQNTLKITKFA